MGGPRPQLPVPPRRPCCPRTARAVGRGSFDAPFRRALGHTAVGISQWHRGAIVDSARHLDAATVGMVGRSTSYGYLSILLGRFCAYFYFCVILIFLPLLWAFEALSTVYFKYELEDISRWINNHWELYSLRVVKSRWEIFYSVLFFLHFFVPVAFLFFYAGL